MRYSALTDLGLVRSNNEDSLYAGDSAVGRLKNLFIVADGMGGHVGGEYASAFVVSKIPDLLEKRQQQEESIEDTLRIVTDRTNKALYQLSRNDKRLQGMGSTLVMASIEEGEAHVINVGDSRLYHFDGTLTQITRDHSYVQELVENGSITQDEARTYPGKNIITRAVGIEENLRVDFSEVTLDQDDVLLLCTDGLTNFVSDEEIAEIIVSSTNFEYAEKLVQAANEHGGGDNITVVTIAS